MRTLPSATSQIAARRGIAVVRFPTEVDRESVVRSREEALIRLNRGVSGLVLDFSATLFCDSSGINAVFRIEHRARAVGAPLRLAVPPRSQVGRAFDLVGMRHAVPVLPSVATAVADITACARAAPLDRPARRPS